MGFGLGVGAWGQLRTVVKSEAPDDECVLEGESQSRFKFQFTPYAFSEKVIACIFK